MISCPSQVKNRNWKDNILSCIQQRSRIRRFKDLRILARIARKKRSHNDSNEPNEFGFRRSTAGTPNVKRLAAWLRTSAARLLACRWTELVDHLLRHPDHSDMSNFRDAIATMASFAPLVVYLEACIVCA